MIKRIENIYVLIIMLCSMSFYSFSVMGRLALVTELMGVAVIIALLAIYIIYGEAKPVRHNFSVFIIFILISLVTSMFMARYAREQGFIQTLYAMHAMYYYLFYYLLHQLKIRPDDLEKIFMLFGLVHVVFYLIQYFLYPTIIFDAHIIYDRGTVRIYMAGSDYLLIAYFMSIQAFFRTNKIKYILLVLLFYSIFVLQGGRQTMAIMAFVLILFLLFSRKVKSRFFIGMLIAVGASLIFIIFQNIFMALIVQSTSDMSLGSDYIRLLTAKYFLTDFFKSPIAYLTGNGMYANNTSYGREIGMLMTARSHVLGDIGIIGNYAIYGAFFILGVFGLCIKALRIKIEDSRIYIRYIFIAVILSLILGAGFVMADFICAVVCLLYILDVSNHNKTQGLKSHIHE